MLVPSDASTASDETRTRRSKIFLSIVYLWTRRGPEINNGASITAAGPFPGPGGGAGGTGRGPGRRRASARDRGGRGRGADGAAPGAAGRVSRAGGPVLAD